MHNDISFLESEVTETLSYALCGIDPGRPIMAKYSLEQIKHFQDCKCFEYAEKALKKRRESFEGQFDLLRETGSGRALSLALRPFYRQLLFEENEYIVKYKYLQLDAPTIAAYYAREVTKLIRYALSKDRFLSGLFEKDYTIIQYMKGAIHADKNGYNLKELFFHSVVAAIEDGYSTDWENVYSEIHNNLQTIIKETDDIKTEYYLRMLAIATVMNTKALASGSIDTLLELIEDNKLWQVILSQYKFQLGIIMYSSVQDLIGTIILFTGDRAPFAHLLYATLTHCNPVEELIKEDYDKQRYEEAYDRLCIESERYQSNLLDKLFNLLFPESALKEYNRISIIAETNKNTLENTISIEEIKQAIGSISTPANAQNLFSQLDLILHKNNAWKKHRDEIVDIIIKKMNGNAPEEDAHELKQALEHQTEELKDAISKKQSIGTMVWEQHNYGTDAIQAAKHNNNKQLN